MSELSNLTYTEAAAWVLYINHDSYNGYSLDLDERADAVINHVRKAHGNPGLISAWAFNYTNLAQENPHLLEQMAATLLKENDE